MNIREHMFSFASKLKYKSVVVCYSYNIYLIYTAVNVFLCAYFVVVYRLLFYLISCQYFKIKFGWQNIKTQFPTLCRICKVILTLLNILQKSQQDKTRSYSFPIMSSFPSRISGFESIFFLTMICIVQTYVICIRLGYICSYFITIFISNAVISK